MVTGYYFDVLLNTVSPCFYVKLIKNHAIEHSFKVHYRFTNLRPNLILNFEADLAIFGGIVVLH